MREPTLFDVDPAPDRLLARRDDPETSKAAAEQAVSSRLVQRHEAAILAALSEMGERGGTKDEIAKVTRLDDVAVARRMAKLRTLGLVETAGKRELLTGRKGTAWRMVAAQEEEAA